MQFCEPLTDRDHQRLGTWFGSNPTPELRLYGDYHGRISNLDFLPRLTRLRKLSLAENIAT